MGKRAFQVSGILTLDMQKFTVNMQKASKDLGTFQRSWQKTYGAMKQSFGTLPGGAGGILAGLGLSLSIKEAVMAGDAYQAMQRRLQQVTKATSDYAKVSQSVFDISQKTSVRLADTERTFRALQMAGKDFGATNTDILKVVEAANKLGVMGGASNEQLSGAMLQFSQVMGKGRLMAQELNIIAENMQPLAEAIKKGLGMNMADLRKQMEAGKVSAQMVFGAILKQTREIDAEFQSFVPTLGQRFNQLANEFSRITGENSVGALKAIGSTMGLITRNMDAFIRLGAIAALVAGLNMARMALGSYHGMLESTARVTNNAIEAFRRAASAKKDVTAATQAMSVAEIKAALDIEKLARSKGVYLSFSDQVREADKKRKEEMSKIGDISRSSAAAQQAFAAKAAVAASNWASKIESAEQKVAKATEAANYARTQAKVSDTIQNSQALQKALKVEAAATAHLAKVREAAAASAAKWDARGLKVAGSVERKLADAAVAADAAAQTAIITKAREIRQMELANGASLAAKAIKDGESAAVIRYMRLIDLETAAQSRNNAAKSMGARLGQVAAASVNVFKTAATGLFTILGGWPGVIFGAATALVMFGDKLDWLWGKQNKLNKSLEEFIKQKEEMAKSAIQIDNEKIQEAQAQLQELQARRRGMHPATQWVGTPFGAAPIGDDPSKVRALEEDIRKKESIIERLIKARDRDAMAESSINQSGSNYTNEHLAAIRETNDILKTIRRDVRPQIGMNATPRSVY